MIDVKVKEIINSSKNYGWILEQDAKFILKTYGIKVPDYKFSKTFKDALEFSQNNYPVVCKVVSPDIVHKSDVGGVIVGIKNDNELKDAFEKLSELKGFKGCLIEKMVQGMELIIGAKNDAQFGPVVLVGMGGVSVEIYKDSAIRMAPLTENDIEKMLESLKCYPLLKGYRGNKGINIEKLKEILLKFSKILIDLQPYFESIDLNPVICSENECFVADARIILV